MTVGSEMDGSGVKHSSKRRVVASKSILLGRPATLCAKVREYIAIASLVGCQPVVNDRQIHCDVTIQFAQYVKHLIEK